MQVAGQTETSGSRSVEPEAPQADPRRRLAVVVAAAVIALLFLPSRPIGPVDSDTAIASPGPPERSSRRTPPPAPTRGEHAVVAPIPREHVADRAATAAASSSAVQTVASTDRQLPRAT